MDNSLVDLFDKFDLGGSGAEILLVRISFGFLNAAVVSRSVSAGALPLLLSKSIFILFILLSFSISLRF